MIEGSFVFIFDLGSEFKFKVCTGYYCCGFDVKDIPDVINACFPEEMDATLGVCQWAFVEGRCAGLEPVVLGELAVVE